MKEKKNKSWHNFGEEYMSIYLKCEGAPLGSKVASDWEDDGFIKANSRDLLSHGCIL